MEHLNILGTGNAMVTNCYNTCFTISNDEGHILIDAGGGNGILKQLKAMKISVGHLEHIFISHKHIDHILGVIWLIRAYGAQVMKGSGVPQLIIYGHNEVLEIISMMMTTMLNEKQSKCLDGLLILKEIHHGSEIIAHGMKFDFFDIGSTKDKQFGFKCHLKSSKTLVFLGDEPYRDQLKSIVHGVDYLLHEAFCLYEERDRYDPYNKHHVTVKEACENAKNLEVRNILLYHTEADDYSNRKERYGKEASQYFHGQIHIPNDLEVIVL